MALIATSTTLLVVGYASAFLSSATWGPWLFAIAIPTLLIGLLLLSLSRRPQRPLRVLAPLAAVWVIFAGGFGTLLLLPPVDPAEPRLWLGLPPGPAITLFGIGLLPALVLPFLYARIFDEEILRPEDLDTLQQWREESQVGGPSSEPGARS